MLMIQIKSEHHHQQPHRRRRLQGLCISTHQGIQGEEEGGDGQEGGVCDHVENGRTVYEDIGSGSEGGITQIMDVKISYNEGGSGWWPSTCLRHLPARSDPLCFLQ